MLLTLTVIALAFSVKSPVTLILPTVVPVPWKDSKAPEFNVSGFPVALMVAVPDVLLPASVCTGLDPVIA